MYQLCFLNCLCEPWTSRCFLNSTLCRWLNYQVPNLIIWFNLWLKIRKSSTLDVKRLFNSFEVLYLHSGRLIVKQEHWQDSSIKSLRLVDVKVTREKMMRNYLTKTVQIYLHIFKNNFILKSCAKKNTKIVLDFFSY